MNTVINKKNIYILVLQIVCFLLVLQLFSKCDNEQVQLANIESLNKDIKSYKLKGGQLVSTVENLTLSNAQLKNSIILKDKRTKELIDKFSKVKSVTKYVTNTKFDTIKLAYKDSVPCKFEVSDSLSNKWYNIAFKSNQKGIEITKLDIPDSITLVTGEKRKWFWGKRTSVTDITHSNPFVKTQSMQHIEVQEKPKWYDNTMFKIGIGILTGVLIVR